MGTITARRRSDGTTGYTAQIRLKREGKVVHTEAETFSAKALARTWMTRREAELQAQRSRGEAVGRRMTIEQMIEWYQSRERPDKPWGRTKRADLARMKAGALAGKRADQLTRSDFIEYTERRRAEGAGPATAANDLIWFRQVFRAADAVLGCPVPMEALNRAAEFLRQAGIIGKPQKRDRRLRDGEEAKILKHFSKRGRGAKIPMRDIILFALATSRREEEITRLLWSDLDRKKGIALLRDVKHPTDKQGNHKEFRMLTAAWAIIDAQPRKKGESRVFPYNPKSVGSAFTRAMPILGIKDLHFHDLRHEATSRFFEAGYEITQVVHFTLHESWQTLKRYTHLRPEKVPDLSIKAGSKRKHSR
jgi:integrase